MQEYNLKDLQEIFKYVGVKTVSKTDISKGAYVVNKEQRTVLEKAGYEPGTYPDITHVPLIFLGTGNAVTASYYGSAREGSGRTPEIRMGRIIDNISVGQEIAFASDGNDIFVAKTGVGKEEPSIVRKAYEESAISSSEELDINELIARAKKAQKKPTSRAATTTQFDRDPAISALARKRSEYKCEMPECDYVGFEKPNGKKFIEAHHITPLSEGGEDSASNVAAVCPTCHKKLHFAVNKEELSTKLRAAVATANKRISY